MAKFGVWHSQNSRFHHQECLHQTIRKYLPLMVCCVVFSGGFLTSQYSKCCAQVRPELNQLSASFKRSKSVSREEFLRYQNNLTEVNGTTARNDTTPRNVKPSNTQNYPWQGQLHGFTNQTFVSVKRHKKLAKPQGNISKERNVNNITSQSSGTAKYQRIVTRQLRIKKNGTASGKTRNVSYPVPYTVTVSPPTTDIRNVYLIKVHKCGSTTLQNIIHRYGIERNFVFAVYECDHGMPFPEPAYERYLIDLLRSRPFKINVISEHARFDPAAFRSYVNPSPVVISSLRHPLRYVESSFVFHGLASLFGIFDSHESDLVAQYFRDPQTYDSRALWQGNFGLCGPYTRPPSYIKNAIAYHFGYSSSWDRRPSRITEFIDKLDETIAFVIIIEQFDESLILLKRLLSWRMKDIIYVPMGSNQGRTKSSRILRSDDEEAELVARHRQWSLVDYMLYEHYQLKLQVTLKQQPPDFYEELGYFNGSLLPTTSRFCLSMCHNFTVWLLLRRNDLHGITNGATIAIPGNKWHEAFIFSYEDCFKMQFGTDAYQGMFKRLYPSCIPGRMDLCYSRAMEYFDIIKFEPRRDCLKQFGSIK